MAKETGYQSGLIQNLRIIALRFPEAQEGIACAGTALESRTVKVRNKAFLFVGKNDLMIKLGESLAEAIKLASKTPGRYKAGANGWIKLTFGDGDSPPPGLLERWIDESYRLLAPKQLVALLPESGSATRDAKKAVAKKGAKNKRGKRRASSR
jgi:hypothetical protein